MALTAWSPRRLLLIWGVGLVLQLGFLLGPPALVAWRWRRLRSEWQQERVRARVMQGRWQLGRAAEAERVATERARGAVGRGRDGAPRYAVVRMPVGPDPALVAPEAAPTRRTIGVARWLQVGAIPLALLVVTAAWFGARMRRLAALARVA